MERAVIVSSNPDITQKAEAVLAGEGFGWIASVTGGNEARRLISGETEPDLVIINMPLSDEFGQELAEMTAENTAAGIILICGNDIAEEIAYSVSDHGINVVPRPLNRETLVQTVRLVTYARSRMMGMKRETPEVLNRIDEMRLINRAKSALMKYLKFTEPQAHRYIAKQAMNNRQTRREVAEKIIAQYEK
ncbi:MAG: ANTAR domain-containing protein [Ruminococcus sp.]|nr:ANTAR domain-containing protein [Ruminococcus sp.]